ncbi:MAG: very short patch repair endonuclease [Gemmataceae bacterium]|nr:very short patch repair endonuclease [Gemmataceae bacterium]
MDRHSKEQRSRNMARIRKFGNESTEMRMLRLFRQHGIKGWRRHLDLPGRPDFTFRRERVVLFIDGCFWHRCPRCNWTPASNTEYWAAKFARNLATDRDANRALRRAGWKVLRIWEHWLKQEPERVVARITRALSLLA